MKRWQKTAVLGGCFRHPFYQSPSCTPGRFSLFRLLTPSCSWLLSFQFRTVAHVFEIHSHSPSPISSKSPILAPLALFPKWTSLDLLWWLWSGRVVAWWRGADYTARMVCLTDERKALFFYFSSLFLLCAHLRLALLRGGIAVPNQWYGKLHLCPLLSS